MNNHNKVKSSFSAQAEKFATYHMSKTEYTDYLIDRLNANGTEKALEVAAGTCICGRAVAPHVESMTCLDLTEAMLEQGKKLSAAENIKNISFVTGDAEALPFPDETFDLVITRLSFHHFTDPRAPFNEMLRTLKTGGKLAVWDTVATSEDLRDINDRIETLRDPSHTRILSRAEFEELFENDLELQTEEITYVPVRLQSWMDLTDTPVQVQGYITEKMTDELNNGEKTGFGPYLKDGEIYFEHRWLLLIGIKK